MRVLVVDDNHMLSMVLSDHLKSRGHEVTVALDGDRARHLGDARCYQVAVLDLVLPRLGGLELAGELMRLHPSLRVILMSGFAELLEQAAPRANELGVAALISKPFSFSELDVVMESLERGAASDARP